MPGCFTGLIVSLVVTAIVACQTVTPETLQGDIEDAAITSVVKSKFLVEPAFHSVNIETVRNQVYLRGVVPTVEERKRARDLAFEVPGVLTVVNNLEVLEGRNL